MVIVSQPQGTRRAPSSRHRQKKKSKMMIRNLIIVVFFLTRFLNCSAIFSLVAILLLLAMASYPVRSLSHVKRSHFFLKNSSRLPAWSCSKKPNRRKRGCCLCTHFRQGWCSRYRLHLSIAIISVFRSTFSLLIR